VAGVPVDEALHVKGDAAGGKVLCDGFVVARRVSRATISLGQPVLVKLDMDAVAPSSNRVNVTIIVAETVSLSVSIPVRIWSASIDGVVGCGTVTVGQMWQVDAINLD